MGITCQICLTLRTGSGSLFLLFPTKCLENNSLRSTLPSTRDALGDSSPDRLTERRSLSMLARLARSTRGRIGTALLALGGGSIAAEKSDAGTIVPGVVVENVYNNQPQRALALDNFDVAGYRIGNADGTADDMVKWFAFELSDDLTEQGFDVDAYIENDLYPNPPAAVISPDKQFGGMRSRYFLVLGDLPEFSSLVYGIATTSDFEVIGLNDALPNAKVYAGFGEMIGTPQTLEEAINLTDLVMVGQYPENVELEDAWIFAQVEPPAPLAGDYDGNRVVDANDFARWKVDYGTAELPYGSGSDGNADGTVNAADYTVWRNNVGADSGGTGAMVVENGGIPEPSTLYLAATGVASAGLGLRRRLRDVLRKRK